MRSAPRLRSGTALLLCLLLLPGYGDGDDRVSETGWTVEEEMPTLEQDLLVSETDSFHFGSVSDVAVAGDGRTFVLEGSGCQMTSTSRPCRMALPTEKRRGTAVRPD